MEKIRIGRIASAVGLKGQVKAFSYSDSVERYGELDRVIIEDREYGIENVRYHKGAAVLKLKGVDDRDASEAMKGKDVFITEKDLKELPKGVYYVRDLIGMEVTDHESGGKIGVIKDVIQNAAQDIYAIELPGGGESLIPAVSEFIKEVDLKARRVRVKLIAGMADR